MTNGFFGLKPFTWEDFDNVFLEMSIKEKLWQKKKLEKIRQQRTKQHFAPIPWVPSLFHARYIHKWSKIAQLRPKLVLRNFTKRFYTLHEWNWLIFSLTKRRSEELIFFASMKKNLNLLNVVKNKAVVRVIFSDTYMG